MTFVTIFNMYLTLIASVPSNTLCSIISLLVQRTMKHTYRKSPFISNKYYELYKELKNKDNKGSIILQ